MMAIFTTVELSTVFDQDPHDFPDHCTVIPMRPGRAEFHGRFRLPDAYGRVRPTAKSTFEWIVQVGRRSRASKSGVRVGR
ncbi:hypothetical protein SAM23877_4108 [Streptomyces ambofaciens ATCC 23877]|uniref:Uncharacterized protein n=1 Tax=Streptomyces ambofaciens (strain ATCC 23877 / 3486 / DSM 40053 / JCM 4204 / NBRC 12836 / NRRL B-2516) TaxID=278992 RepID=A0A0K2AVZ8_STRA7|nr:hypothetical protein SAM23877_4108 [Streptomyces ambofaciens ATCC 23877]